MVNTQFTIIPPPVCSASVPAWIVSSRRSVLLAHGQQQVGVDVERGWPWQGRDVPVTRRSAEQPRPADQRLPRHRVGPGQWREVPGLLPLLCLGQRWVPSAKLMYCIYSTSSPYSNSTPPPMLHWKCGIYTVSSIIPPPNFHLASCIIRKSSCIIHKLRCVLECKYWGGHWCDVYNHGTYWRLPWCWLCSLL